jgi:hypothetical protein
MISLGGNKTPTPLRKAVLVAGRVYPHATTPCYPTSSRSSKPSTPPPAREVFQARALQCLDQLRGQVRHLLGFAEGHRSPARWTACPWGYPRSPCSKDKHVVRQGTLPAHRR